MNQRVLVISLSVCCVALITACTDNWPPLNSSNESDQNPPANNLPVRTTPVKDTSQIQVVTENELFGIVYVNGKYIATGETETIRGNGRGGSISGIILLSPDSLSWARKDSSTTGVFSCAAYGDSLFVAVGSNRADCYLAGRQHLDNSDFRGHAEP